MYVRTLVSKIKITCLGGVCPGCRKNYRGTFFKFHRDTPAIDQWLGVNIIMNFIIQILISSVLGIYSSVGLNFYSKMIEKTKSDFTRFVLFILAIGLLAGLPIMIINQIFQMANFEMTTNHRFVLFMVWGVSIWVFIIKNWRILNKRLSTIPK